MTTLAMASLSRGLCLLLALVCYTDGEYMFNQADQIHNITSYGVSLDLDCYDRKYLGAKPFKWMLPDLELVDVYYENSEMEMKNDGWVLHLKSVEANNLGYYQCLLQTYDGEPDNIKFGVNALSTPQTDDLWRKYKHNTMVGGLAALATVVAIIILALTFKFYQKREKPKVIVYQAPPPVVGPCYAPPPVEVKIAEQNGAHNLAYDEPIDNKRVDINPGNPYDATSL